MFNYTKQKLFSLIIYRFNKMARVSRKNHDPLLSLFKINDYSHDSPEYICKYLNF